MSALKIRNLAVPAIALSAGLMASSPAFAGDKENLATCWAALAADAQVATTDIQFKSLSGSSMQRINFEVKKGEETAAATCKIKRGKVIEIAYAS